MYKFSQVDKVLNRPVPYIGSVLKKRRKEWIYKEKNQLVYQEINYVPGLCRIFDEILVNAADNRQRDQKMDSLKVWITPSTNEISVYNNGNGVPVHEQDGVYLPQSYFGDLGTGSNLDDSVKRTTGGSNGDGAKLTNIFSTEFIIETADGKRKYKQVFTANMRNKSKPEITECKSGENWTKVTFKPDLARFNMKTLEDEDVVALMKKRVIDLAGILGRWGVIVELNDELVELSSFSDFMDLYFQSADEKPPIHKYSNERWDIGVCISYEGECQQVSFVNGISTVKGGAHLDYITDQITNHALESVTKSGNIKASEVKTHLWVFVNALIDNPSFDSRAKESLNTPIDSFGSTCELSHDFLEKVVKTLSLSWADFKLMRDLRKLDGYKRKWEDAFEANEGPSEKHSCHGLITDIPKLRITDIPQLTDIPNLEDAFEAGGTNSKNCTLILTKGDPAKARVPRSGLNSLDTVITYINCVNEEHIWLCRADLRRSIPSVMDGFKPSQRKVLFAAFQGNLVKETGVSQFAGYVAKKSAYHDGDLYGTIISMAQNFVGSNNVNLFTPAGRFGSRLQGGKDHADPWYLNTCLENVSRFLFPKEDDAVLDYVKEDGLMVEPIWYAPVIPMVLVNGCVGIGIDLSSFIPNFNPRDIIAKIRGMLDNKNLPPLDPFYRSFLGSIKKSEANTYTVKGVIASKDEKRLMITELPLGQWTDEYKLVLSSAVKDGFIKEFRNYSTDRAVRFEVSIDQEKLPENQEERLKKLKLTTSISTANMNLFDATGEIKKYSNAEEILKDFYKLRLEMYEKRKKYLVSSLEEEEKKLKNKVRFIKDVDDLTVNWKDPELLTKLRELKYDPFQDEPVVNSQEGAGYGYLLYMPCMSFTEEKRQELNAEMDKVTEQLADMKTSTPQTLWLKDLDALEVALNEKEKNEKVRRCSNKKSSSILGGEEAR